MKITSVNTRASEFCSWAEELICTKMTLRAVSCYVLPNFYSSAKFNGLMLSHYGRAILLCVQLQYLIIPEPTILLELRRISWKLLFIFTIFSFQFGEFYVLLLLFS